MILDFKGLSINIIIVYVAPTSLEVQKNIKEYLKKYLKDIETKKKAQRSQAENQRVRKRLEIDMENIIDKNWEEYQANLSKELKRKLLKDSEKRKYKKISCKHFATKEKDLCNREYSTHRCSNQKAEKRYMNAEKMEVKDLEQFIEPLKNCWVLEVVKVVK
ncbi:2963_t:CDS:2 [Gigaspora margarita]|uniref:2963_t:CDS:1 n=1 Tax=Gigaspora margarita TaxID=4874 RepID=A0ABN7W090_GIGMA|nr:2963_t:CDS:2 [Gigaspora margarita]